MDKCSTCERKKIVEMSRDKNEKRFRYKYYARIMERTERDLGLTGHWTFAGDHVWSPGPLNYCPECGRAVKYDADP